MSDAIKLDTIRQTLQPVFEQRAREADRTGEFVDQNYDDLVEHRVFSALVPRELGGGGASYSDVTRFVREIGHACGSTALALSMHQHLVAAAAYKVKRGQPGQALLEKVATNQAVLVSTGAKDWLESNGEMERVDGGYRVTARKPFASGSVRGALFVTSSRYFDPETGQRVLHFAVPRNAEGVEVGDDWDTLGMRATGSNTVSFDRVFVPDEAIALEREAGAYHPAWSVVLTVAMPLIVSAYVGVAEAAAVKTIEIATKRAADPITQALVGEMTNELRSAQLAQQDMVRLCDDFRTDATTEIANEMLIRKTLAARAVKATVAKALEAAGGFGFHRASGLERLVRDAQGIGFHPLPEKSQVSFSGRLALGLEPLERAVVEIGRAEAAA